jgi:ankyrin repeat protein
MKQKDNFCDLCRAGNNEKVKEMLDSGHVPTRTFDGRHPFVEASFEGHLEIVKLLLPKVESVNVQDKQGFTALHVLTFWDSADLNEETIPILNFLLENGADVNIVDEDGDTTIMIAAERCPELMPYLLQAGADPNDVFTKGIDINPKWLFSLDPYVHKLSEENMKKWKAIRLLGLFV